MAAQEATWQQEVLTHLELLTSLGALVHSPKDAASNTFSHAVG